MALGAQAANVLRLVVWQGMRLVLLGLALGALTGYGLKRLWRASISQRMHGSARWQSSFTA